MSYSEQEKANLLAVKDALAASAHDFTKFFAEMFAEDAEWTIAGHGPVARTYFGMEDLFTNAEEERFTRFAEPLRVEPKGIWADGDRVFAHIESATTAKDGKPYANSYMYIMSMKDGRVVSGIEWLDLNAYYEILDRVHV